MGSTLDALHRLQAIEGQLRSLRGQIESKHRAAAAYKRRFTTHEQKIAQTQDAIQKALAEADRLELERKQHDDHARKLREALNQAKTNKEYAAVLTQLNTDKADAVRLEDAVLAALSKVDEFKAQLEKDRADLQREQARLADLENSAKAVADRLAGPLEELESKRQAAASDVPPAPLKLFERARDSYDGEAMAMVERTHPRRTEYICGGCHMTLTLETINALQSKDDVQICGTCSRILYIEAPSGVAAL